MGKSVAPLPLLKPLGESQKHLDRGGGASGRRKSRLSVHLTGADRLRAIAKQPIARKGTGGGLGLKKLQAGDLMASGSIPEESS